MCAASYARTSAKSDSCVMVSDACSKLDLSASGIPCKCNSRALSSSKVREVDATAVIPFDEAGGDADEDGGEHAGSVGGAGG